MVMVDQRPDEVADRIVPGPLGDLPHGRTPDIVRDVLIATMQAFPTQLARSVTWDHGTELARHHEFTTATGLPVYFCEPHSPWQRRTNENTNGLLRQYFLKGTDLSRHTRARLDEVAAELNDRPRKILGWDTPAERLATLIGPGWAHHPTTAGQTSTENSACG
ncbi:hypothetical protein CBI38_31375 (plasmid) [Rhodococcus oxybenzonivorans]|uniref:Integrase catalytic domain-containing protein n=1 Tax=Rhodococcus oxybenzonivorans TaxID=1990687 RepID=A0A2S2C5H2_9NOCA|nr:hypothetical protein CBI38_31375 [Rhodococcus oxybenzonivorans]